MWRFPAGWPRLRAEARAFRAMARDPYRRRTTMSKDLYYLGASALLTWVMVMVTSGLRAFDCPNPIGVAFGNRDNLVPPSPMSGRAERATRNMLENMVLFCALILAAHVAGVLGPRVALGAQIFFWARLVYFFVYLAGIAYVRTLVWAVSIVGLGIILSALLA